MISDYGKITPLKDLDGLRQSLGLNEGVSELGLKPVLHPWLNNCPIRRQNDKEHLPQRSFNHVLKTDEPEWDRHCPELLRFQCADLCVIKGCHKISGDLSRFLFGDGMRRILFTDLKDLLKRATIFGRTSVSKQLN
jgi:hypothetical protein